MTEQTTQLLAPGTIVDDEYEIHEFLGHGQTSTVYRAHHKHSRRDVALKILTVIEFVDEADAKVFRERFSREARAAAAVQHPNVATFFSCGFTGDRLYLAMQLLKGHDLGHELAARGPMSPTRALSLFRPCLVALGAIHKNGIVHRDLGPRNLFVNEPGTPLETLVLMDFGLALLDDGDLQKRLTRPGQVLGTPAYTSPEAFKADLSVPARDVYAMGLLLVEALTGRRMAPSDDLISCMDVHCNGKLRAPRWLLESALGPVLVRALAVDHEKRFADAKAFAEALSPIAAESVVVGNNEDLVDLASFEVAEEKLPARVAAPRPAVVETRAAEDDDVSHLMRRRPGSDRTFLVAIVALVVLGIVALAMLMTR